MASVGVLSAPGVPGRDTKTSIPLPSLRSNQGDYIDKSSTRWMRSTHPDTPLEEMRWRYKEDGYIWVKNVIPREAVYDMREQYACIATRSLTRMGLMIPYSYFFQFGHTGMLRPGTSPRKGIFNPSSDPNAHEGIGGLPEEATEKLLDAAHADPYYRTFLAHPALRAFIRHFTGWKQEVIVDRAMLRHNCPGSKSTGIHYDQYFLRDGDDEFLTAWVCTLEPGSTDQWALLTFRCRCRSETVPLLVVV